MRSWIIFIISCVLMFLGLAVFLPCVLNFVKYLLLNRNSLPPEELLTAVAVACLLAHCFIYIYTFSVGMSHFSDYTASILVLTNGFTVLPALVCSVIPGRLSLSELSFSEEQVSLKQGFIRYISHEMRTPLNVANIGIEILEETFKTLGIDTEETRELTSHIKTAVSISIEILNDILTYEKISSSLMVLELSLVTPVAFIRECCSLFQRQATSMKIHLVLPQVDSAIGVILETRRLNVDASKMGQVIRNLLSNALKFTPVHGTITVALAIVEAPSSPFPLQSHPSSISPSKSWLRVDVQDTGVGIAPENLKRVFHEIIQFDANRLQSGKGSGLGLYISRGIVELHGGRVYVQSDGIGTGCKFSLELPLDDGLFLPLTLASMGSLLMSNNSNTSQVQRPQQPQQQHSSLMSRMLNLKSQSSSSSDLNNINNNNNVNIVLNSNINSNSNMSRSFQHFLQAPISPILPLLPYSTIDVSTDAHGYEELNVHDKDTHNSIVIGNTNTTHSNTNNSNNNNMDTAAAATSGHAHGILTSHQLIIPESARIVMNDDTSHYVDNSLEVLPFTVIDSSSKITANDAHHNLVNHFSNNNSNNNNNNSNTNHSNSTVKHLGGGYDNHIAMSRVPNSVSMSRLNTEDKKRLNKPSMSTGDNQSQCEEMDKDDLLHAEKLKGLS